jgi:hypothetical protein
MVKAPAAKAHSTLALASVKACAAREATGAVKAIIIAGFSGECG